MWGIVWIAQDPHIFDPFFSFRITLLPRAQNLHCRIVKLHFVLTGFHVTVSLCVVLRFLAHPCVQLVQLVSLHNSTDPLFSITFNNIRSRPIAVALFSLSHARTLRSPHPPYL